MNDKSARLLNKKYIAINTKKPTAKTNSSSKFIKEHSVTKSQHWCSVLEVVIICKLSKPPPNYLRKLNSNNLSDFENKNKSFYIYKLGE